MRHGVGGLQSHGFKKFIPTGFVDVYNAARHFAIAVSSQVLVIPDSPVHDTSRLSVNTANMLALMRKFSKQERQQTLESHFLKTVFKLIGKSASSASTYYIHGIKTKLRIMTDNTTKRRRNCAPVNLVEVKGQSRSPAGLADWLNIFKLSLKHREIKCTKDCSITEYKYSHGLLAFPLGPYLTLII